MENTVFKKSVLFCERSSCGPFSSSRNRWCLLFVMQCLSRDDLKEPRAQFYFRNVNYQIGFYY